MSFFRIDGVLFYLKILLVDFFSLSLQPIHDPLRADGFLVWIYVTWDQYVEDKQADGFIRFLRILCNVVSPDYV